MKTIAELYAAQSGIPLAEAEDAILARCLYPPARLLRAAIVAVRPRHFDPDRALVCAVIRQSQAREIARELEDYRARGVEGGPIRRHAGLRISSRRLESLARETLACAKNPRLAGAPPVSPPLGGFTAPRPD